MGDIVEITTGSHYQNLWYKLSSNALRFEVKCSGNAVIYLGRKANKSDYAICIGDRNMKSFIQGSKGNIEKEQFTPNLLSPNEYRGFWLSWCNNVISLGRDGEAIPFLTAASQNENINVTSDLKYVCFKCNTSNQMHWRVEFPPKLPTALSTRTITDGKVEWKTADESLPDGALIGGYEDESLYIIRAKHEGSLTPGKFVPSEGEGYVPWGGRAAPAEDPEVLCGFDCVWVPCARNEIPLGAVEGGYSEVAREKLYVGRAYHAGHLIPGKVQLSHKCCYIPYEGREISKQQFEILVEPNHNSRAVDVFKPPASERVLEDPPTPPGEDYDESDNDYGDDEMVMAF